MKTDSMTRSFLPAMVKCCLLGSSFVFSTLHVAAEPLAEGCVKFLGNISTSTPPGNFGDYWNQVTLEDNGKWINVEQNRNQMNWSAVTAAYNYCKQHGIPYKHHTFVWKEQSPSWMNTIPANEQKEEVEELMREFGEKFPETAFIDVVNEPREKSPSWKTALGGEGETGYDWLVWSYQKAREHCPNAKLLINEYYCEYSLEFVTDYLKMIKVLKEKDLIDGIGIQCHDGETKRGYDSAMFKICLDSLATAGIPLYPSEFDISGTDDEQLHYFSNIFPIMWEHPAVHGVTLWGWTDSWLLRLSKPKDGRLIINGQERPALVWLKEYMATHKDVTDARSSAVRSGPVSRSAVITDGQGVLRLHVADAQALMVRLLDPAGRVVFSCAEKAYSRGTHTLFLPNQSMGTGCYLLSVQGSHSNMTKKVLRGNR